MRAGPKRTSGVARVLLSFAAQKTSGSGTSSSTSYKHYNYNYNYNLHPHHPPLLSSVMVSVRDMPYTVTNSFKRFVLAPLILELDTDSI